MEINTRVNVSLRLYQWLMLLGWISAHVRDETPDPIADALASTSTQINEASGHYVQ